MFQSEASDRRHIFSVELERSKTVGDLKDSIKEKGGSDLDNIPARKLALYQVSIPDADGFEERVKTINLEGMKDMSSTEVLSQAFPSVASRHVHVIIRVPSLLHKPIVSLSNRYYSEGEDANDEGAKERRDEISALHDSGYFFVYRSCHPT